MRILLVGMMGAGKTTIGRRLAVRTGWPLLDNDQLVRELTGREPASIAAEDGEDQLHDAETEALMRALDREPPLIAGVAGAVVERSEARDRMRSAGHVVWLRARPETLRTRIGTGRGRRPEAVDPGWLERHAKEREPLYRDVADQVIDVDDVRPSSVADAILEAVAIRSAD